ncbi:hypothetical protein RHGRI_037851 [Rhododendron griersonianum]|uniref:BRCT domain-containing protein n=1 Tax=Rhododendron griersonianum TaxID=479676 RepID=A0AAV6HX77_9ERIC|nr:hypothetical protein RHGRI_037851 [Rhododendron griersonianum]
MTSMSKHVNTGDGEDRISSLPDSLLIHILSLIPTKYAVRTCILSLRWKDLWSFVPSLDFNEWLSANTVPDNDISFMNFVDRVLLLHKLPSIERFAVRGHSGIAVSRLCEWIRVAIKRHVRVIDIQMFPHQHISLPSELFTCKTLIQLSLVSELVCDTLLSSVWLPNLKDLHVSLDYPGNDITQKLFSSCPVLENLYISANMESEEDIVFNVCAPALKRLQFNLAAFFENGLVLTRNKIVVDAPVLEVLIVDDDYLACYSLKNPSSLVSAYIDVGDRFIEAIGLKEHANQIFMLLEGITNVKFLTLQTATMAVLDFADDNKLPLFPNLIHLKLFVPNGYSWRRLPDLLVGAPNLATLVLSKNHASEEEDDLVHEFCWVEPQRTPTCLLSKLEELEVILFQGEDDELKLLKYFLENGKVLKELLIYSCHLTFEEKWNFFEKSDIRKWFMKQHDKNNGNAPKPAKPAAAVKLSPVTSQQENVVHEDQESSGRRKTSKYFATEKQKPKDEKELEELSAKRKGRKEGDVSSDVKLPPLKKLHKVDEDVDNDDDYVFPSSKKGVVDVTPNKKLKSGSGRGIAQKPTHNVESDEDKNDEKDTKPLLKSAGRGRGGKGASSGQAGSKGIDVDESDEEKDNDTKSAKATGRGRGGKGASAAPGGGRGRGGGGRGGFMNFGERKDPPHKGEKEVPEGAPDCLAGFTFVISGTLDSLEREEAEALIKRHGGRVTGSVSKKTNYLLCDEDVEGRKSSKAKELGTAFLSEDGLFEKIRASNQGKAAAKEESKKAVNKVVASPVKKSPQKVEVKNQASNPPAKSAALKGPTASASPAKQKVHIKKGDVLLPWTEKYRPKVPNDIVGNQSLVKQLHDWLTHWDKQFLNTGGKGKGKKHNDSGAKKAVLLSGTPGIGKTTSAKLVSQMLGFQPVEELVSNEALSVNMDRSKHPKTVLIMDEVDGMSAGDRGGVADLIASIKISKVPIICICNDRYSQKLKSLVNYCLLLSFRKPTKQQIALEELAERVNGDIRMALNQLQYMSLSMSVIKYEDVRERLLSSAKDEDISPFTAVDKLFGFNGGKLRMDERINLSMSDPDLVPLIIQENYINYRPSSVGKDDDGIKRLKSIARAAESIADGDIINVQIRRYRQWQLSQTGTLASCIIPAALLHGQREILEQDAVIVDYHSWNKLLLFLQGERNFNRFGGWLGKNSTMGKNLRLLEDMHVHLLASRGSGLGRTTLRVDYLTLLLKQLIDPLRVLPKDEAVEKVVEFMDFYSISQEDFDSMVEMSKFKGHPNPLDGIQPAVKAALTKAYNKGSRSRVIRTADLINLPGIKKAPKKRIAAMLEPVEDGLAEGNGDALAENEENSSDTEDLGDDAGEEKPELDLQSLNSKGIQVDMDLKGGGTKGAKKAPLGRGKGGAEAADKKGGGRGSGSAVKRKR